ncbi:MAG: competence/damage-inducible protein A [Chloroflexi bacterium]|nr:competence/damage-inducible protein A [Chloroflexota bacterium]
MPIYAEIVASGTELLMGESQDTDSSYIGSRLPALGLELRQVSLVGDDLERYVEVLKRSFTRNQFTFTTGGLGPTVDDVTREAIAKVFGEEVYVDPVQQQWLIDLFKSRGTQMPSRNIKQAWLIPSAVALPNRVGTAPGWWAERDGHVLIALPGPPRELAEMWEKEAAPRIKARVTGSVVLTRTIKTIGLGEAIIDEMATEVLGIENPYVGTYARPDGIHLRIIARGSNEQEAKRLLEPVDHKLRAIFGKNVWGIDDETPEDSVGTVLRVRRQTLATMESCTGGMLADSITNVPGSSSYYKGGIISYTNDLKVASGVPADLIETYGAVSEEVAAAMAQAIRLHLDADYGIGVTGVAGPDALEGKPPGTVYIGIAGAREAKASYHRFPANNRGLVKRRAVTAALLALRTHLLEV